jgi:hypothetical protein
MGSMPAGVVPALAHPEPDMLANELSNYIDSVVLRLHQASAASTYPVGIYTLVWGMHPSKWSCMVPRTRYNASQHHLLEAPMDLPSAGAC